MREIKFRAWFELGKSMYGWDDIRRIDSEGVAIHNEGQWFWDDESRNRIILMQYTDLKDKNGTEIYEGDIVKMWWGYSPGREGTIYQNHAIEFSSGEVGPCCGENVMQWKLHDCSNLWNGKDVEVIGNIHENPELLKEE